MTRTIATLLAACTLAAAGTASAQISRSIVYGDLDLSTVAGARTFDARVTAAARSFCDEDRRITRTMCERGIRREAHEKLPAQARAAYASSRQSMAI